MSIAVVHDIGTPPQESNCWSYNEFRLHNFANLSNFGYRSPNFECLGHRWVVIVWPYGHTIQGTSMFLWCRGNDDKDISDSDGIPNIRDNDDFEEDIERAHL